MASDELPTISDLRQFVLYDPDSGLLTWVARQSYNSRVRIGSEAFGYVGYHGYKMGRFGPWSGGAHRVAWAIYYGAWPTKKIDHINGDRTDNRIANLREATDQENAANRRLKGGKYSSFKGVTAHVKPDRIVWLAGICVNRKRIHLGQFRCETAAALAYDAAAKQHFGDFASVNFAAQTP